MKNAAVFVFLCLASCQPGCGAVRKTSPILYYPQIHAAAERERAVRVDVFCPSDGSVRAGSGAVFAPGRIVTAFHVVACPSIEGLITVATFPSGETKVTGVYAVDPKGDVAVLAFEFDPNDPKDAVEPLRPGLATVDRYACIVTGYPHRSRHCGIVQEITDDWVRTTMFAERGNSGSAVYDEDGGLIGILTHVLLSADGVPTGSRIDRRVDLVYKP